MKNDINPDNYEDELVRKRFKLGELFSPYTQRAVEVFKSEPAHYRMRAEFRVWHDGDDLYFYMFDKESQQKVRTNQFLPASLLINQAMDSLISSVRTNSILRHKLFQVDFLSTLSGEILISLLYHKKLDEQWINEARLLKAELQKKFNINLIGRARKQKIELDRDFVIESLKADGREIIYKQIENSFTQPNAFVAIKMLEWAIGCAKEINLNAKADLLELYCGNGNFSIALAPYFNKVLATELASPSVMAAQFNIEKNNAFNVDIIRMSAEEFSEAMKGSRQFQRLREIDLSTYNFSAILVDPPRSGLDSVTLELVKNYAEIIYISCNPSTLLENMEKLNETHQIKKLALFDQFPYTEHLECGVWLSKKS